MRTKLIAGNWKMNTTLADAHVLADGVRNQAEHLEHIEIVLCPPAVWLSDLVHGIGPGQFAHLKLGAQNMHFEEKGAFTGEISPLMVREVAEYVILGHSERTHLFYEGGTFISRKLVSAFSHGLRPILCVGEDVQSDTSVDQVVDTVREYVQSLLPSHFEALTVAYEPVWAIGSGTPATPEYAQEVAAAIRVVVGDKVRILYGGSVDAENAAGFLAMPDIDGFLIGGASLKLKAFLSVCEQANDLSIPKRAA